MAQDRVGRRKKRALANEETIWFGDESGANLTPVVGKTWAPSGETPFLHHNMGRWDKVNAISAVSHTGRMHFSIKVGTAINSKDVARFLEHIVRYNPGRHVVFLDNANQHKGRPVRDVVEKYADRLRLVFLPPYGFEYNPDEGVWSYLKWHLMRHFAARGTDELVGRIRSGLMRIQRQPRLIRGFFRNTKLPKEDIQALIGSPGYL